MIPKRTPRIFRLCALKTYQKASEKQTAPTSDMPRSSMISSGFYRRIYRAKEKKEPPPLQAGCSLPGASAGCARRARNGRQSISGKAEDSATVHGTQKPAECMARAIRNNSSAGQVVYEPFSGSGTTIIACEMEGRACHAIELHPPYVDVAILRWQSFTGESARYADGRSFGEIATVRRPG